MKMRKLALYALLASWAFVQFGCGKDDGPSNPDDGPVETFYNITQATINDHGYTAPGTLSFLYSVDNGESYTAEKPQDLSKGDELWVKINNGEVDIFEEDFYFDWSGSSIAPADAESDLAKFVVKESDITLSATVSDKVELLVSHRNSGQFFVVDLSDGGLTPAFNITLDGDDVIDIRSMVYNWNNGKLYATLNEDGNPSGALLQVEPYTLTASVLNDNADETWKGMSDLVITEENTILATVGFGGGENPAIIEFNLDGSTDGHILFTGETIPCCGLGLTHGTTASEYLVGDGFSTTIHKSNASGEISETIELSLEGFWED
ncbi:MAG: hypothetical protein AB3N10_20565, partial [Allomuricauda sp.]